MKKLMLMIFALSMLLGLAACGGGSEAEQKCTEQLKPAKKMLESSGSYAKALESCIKGREMMKQ
jgi:ABC-type glycerol-3-phosphate transport system substrate-binding protein